MKALILTSLLIFCVVASVALIRPVLALDLSKFDLKTETIYQLSENNTTKVTINYNLTNLSSGFFASQYVVNLNSAKIKNLKAFDASGALQIESKTDGEKVREVVTFKSPVAGIGKVQKWTVSYDSDDFIKKNGSLFQIMLPPPYLDDYTTDYSVILKIPENIARPVSFSPPPSKTQSGSFLWTKLDLKSSGIYSVFSTKNPSTPFVTYNFKINYKISNPKLTPVNLEVPLPPDTNYQKVFLKEVSPQPLDVRVDEDGNWLAKYYLGSNGKLEISALGVVALFQKPTITTFIPKSDMKKLLSSDQFWETGNSGITAEAEKYNSVKEIYDGVIGILKVRPPEKSPDARRSGAQYTLLAGTTASGQDFTDLFITLSRARKVPSREIIGVIPSSTSDSPQLQSWVQYYQTETNSWRMIDPSLEVATKGLNYFSDWDLNHFALILRGQSSTKPFFPNFSVKDSFNITLSPSEQDVDVFTQPKVVLRPDIPAHATAGFPISGKLFVENAGPTIRDSETIRLNSSQFSLITTSLETGILPPFSSKSLDIKIQSPNWLGSTNGTISLETSDAARDFQVTIEPIYKAGFIQVLGILIILGAISLGIQVGRAVTKKNHDHS